MHPCKVPASWRAAGARFGTDGLLYVNEWRRGFTVHELRALFFECQQVRWLQRELDQAKIALQRAQEAQDKAEARAAWYRRQAHAAARLGLMLERLG